jgi:hypothetical protein
MGATMRKKFVWEKWVDPFGTNLNEVEFPGYDKPFYEEDEDNPEFQFHAPHGHPIIPTPFGMLSMTEHTKAANKFDFWMLHTNFDITEGIKSIVASIPGVESVEVFTRYRMRIAFPRSGLFDTAKVKTNIQNAILDADQIDYLVQLSEFDSFTTDKAMEACNTLTGKNDYWGMYVLPNGNISIVTSNESDQLFAERMTVFQHTQSLVGGQVLSSN